LPNNCENERPVLMDSAQIYSSTLEQLNKTVVRLTSPELDAKVQGAPPEQRQEALAELLRVQHARLVLANAALQEIAEQLKANEQNLLDGQKALQLELDKLATDEAVLKAISSLVNVVARIRSEEHTSELQSRFDLVCRLLLEKKK